MALLATIGYVGAVVGRRAFHRAAAVGAVAAAPRRLARGFAPQEEKKGQASYYDRGDNYRVFHYALTLRETQQPAALVEERSDEPTQY